MKRTNDSSGNAKEPITRRDLLSAAALGAIGVATAGTVNAAQSRSQSYQPKSTRVELDKSAMPQPLRNVNLTQVLTQLDRNGKEAISDLVEPIDVGADALLESYRRAQLTYPPNQVEYLVDTLSQHVSACIDIRRQAQELEAQALETKLRLDLDKSLNELARIQADFNKENMGRLLSNKVDAHIKEDGEIAGVPADDDFYKAVAELEDGYVTARANDLAMRTTYFHESGNGANFVGRFRFLKELFNLELVEAYQRARSISAGLSTYYGIGLAAPDPTRVGYLDKLATWTRGVVYALERKLLGRHEINVVLPLVKTSGLDIGVIESLDFIAQRAAGHFRFELTEGVFSRSTVKIKKPLLRGLDIAFVGAQRKDVAYWGTSTVLVKLADQEIRDTSGKDTGLRLAPKTSITPVDFERNESLSIPAMKALHNADPITDWELTIDKFNTSGHPLNHNNNVQNIVLIMRLTCDVA